MDIKEIFAQFDALCEEKSDAELEAWLIEKCGQYDAEHAADRHGRSALYNELGGFYRARGVYDKGETAFLKAKDILEENYFEEIEVPASSCGCSSCGCSVDMETGDEKVLSQMITNCRDSLDYATTLNNLAGLYRLSGEFEKALKMFDESMALYDELGNAPADVYASCFNNKGLVYIDLKDGLRAMEYFEKALEALDGAEYNGCALGATYSNMAYANLLNGERVAAGENMKTAAGHFLKSNGENDEAYRYCSDMAEKLGALQ